jgi:hypothetical protein
MNDIVESEGREIVEQREVMDLRSVFMMALEAARDPEIDAEKMALLVSLATGQQDREAERRFRIAKQRALLEMPTISKRGAILNKSGQVQSRYSKYEDIHAAVKPILEKHHLSISFNVNHEGQLVTVQPILSYADAEVAYEQRGGEMALPIDTTGSKNATQGAGSAASYGKRHQLKAMLNIVEAGEDDDGQGTAPALPPERQELVDLARERAKGGTDAYAEFFNGLETADKGFLNYAVAETGETYHEQNKKAARLYD